MDEKHSGKIVTFKMNVESMHQNNALSRQCNEAVRIKEVNPKECINNKEEFHQPGDIEVTYTKNDNYNNNKNIIRNAANYDQNEASNNEVETSNEKVTGTKDGEPIHEKVSST